MRKIYSFLTTLSIFLSAMQLAAQERTINENYADSLHKQYRFDEAIAAYRQLIEFASDSLKKIELENKIVQSLNGKSMLDFAFEPKVVTKKSVEFDNFFLNYPGFENGAWAATPSYLTDKRSSFAYTYFPKDAKQIFYSAPDKEGAWNIYTINKINDTLWSAPRLLNESITTIGNEIFPYLSSDGKDLYFSSNGHYGAGGYDLYVSHWNEEINDWDIPQNLGFPYSSPQNDYLLYNTPDGLYTIFASDRNAGKDSVNIYVLEFENIPLKSPVTPEEAVRIARLNIKKANTSEFINGHPSENTNNGSATNIIRDSSDTESGIKADNNDNLEYTAAVKRVRTLQRQLDTVLKQLKESRNLYNKLTDLDDLIALEKTIGNQESQSISLQADLTKASDSLQQIEMEFLTKGIIIPVENEKSNQSLNDFSIVKHEFAFAASRLGKAPALNMEKPEPDFDYSFTITKEETKPLDIINFPTSLTYQIQLFQLSKQASPKSLKGITPVFERRNAAGRYSYAAGLFGTYGEALSHLNSIKRLGFSNASIIAYDNGVSIPVKNARIIEKANLENFVYQITIAGFDSGLPELVLNAIKENSEKDIAKTIDNGAVIYVIGPYTKQSDAEKLASAIRSISDSEIKVVKKEIK